MRLYIDSQTVKQNQDCNKIEKMLMHEFGKEKFSRAMKAEDSLIGQIVEGINRIHCIYFIISGFTVVRYQCDKIVDYSHHIDDKEKARSTLYPAFGIILYAESILKDPEISKQCKFFRKKNPEVKEATVCKIIFSNLKSTAKL